MVAVHFLSLKFGPLCVLPVPGFFRSLIRIAPYERFVDLFVVLNSALHPLIEVFIEPVPAIFTRLLFQILVLAPHCIIPVLFISHFFLFRLQKSPEHKLLVVILAILVLLRLVLNRVIGHARNIGCHSFNVIIHHALPDCRIPCLRSAHVAQKLPCDILFDPDTVVLALPCHTIERLLVPDDGVMFLLLLLFLEIFYSLLLPSLPVEVVVVLFFAFGVHE